MSQNTRRAANPRDTRPRSRARNRLACRDIAFGLAIPHMAKRRRHRRHSRPRDSPFPRFSDPTKLTSHRTECEFPPTSPCLRSIPPTTAPPFSPYQQAAVILGRPCFPDERSGRHYCGQGKPAMKSFVHLIVRVDMVASSYEILPMSPASFARFLTMAVTFGFAAYAVIVSTIVRDESIGYVPTSHVDQCPLLRGAPSDCLQTSSPRPRSREPAGEVIIRGI